MPKKKFKVTGPIDPEVGELIRGARKRAAWGKNIGDIYKNNGINTFEKMKSNMEHVQVTPGKWVTKGK